MLSAGLLAVAVGLTALTVWYWRFTSPRRAARPEPPAEVEPAPPSEPEPGPAIDARPALEPEATVGQDPEWAVTGLDDEQWAILSQAVLDSYFD